MELRKPWKYLPRFKYFDYRRSDRDEVEQDTRKIETSTAKDTELNVKSNLEIQNPAEIFVHELAQTKYHTIF